jgi:parallel beta-helix repeat protein
MGFQKGSDNQIFNNSVSYQGGNGILLEGAFNSKLRRFNVYDNVVRHSSYNNHPNISAYFAIWLDETDGINVYDNTFYAENGRGFAIGGTDNSKIIRNKFLDIFSGVEDSERRKADAGYMYDGEGQTLKNNVIAHNIFAGKIAMGLDMLAQNTDTSLSSMINNKVVNNIFYSTRSDKVQMNDLS